MFSRFYEFGGGLINISYEKTAQYLPATEWSPKVALPQGGLPSRWPSLKVALLQGGLLLRWSSFKVVLSRGPLFQRGKYFFIN